MTRRGQSVPGAHRWRQLAADLHRCDECDLEVSDPDAHHEPCRPGPEREHNLHGARCRVIRVLLERVAAGEGLAAVERDCDLCPGTLRPIERIRARARDRGQRDLARRRGIG